MTLPWVSSGITRLGRKVLIIDPATGEPVDPDRVGEIWIGGPGLPTEYWGNAEATERTFGARPVGGGEGPYLRSGDLGFVRDGGLYVTGRCKDVVIVGGRNHYPQDIEATVEDAHDAIRRSCAAAFSVEDAESERVIVVVGVGQGAVGNGDAAARKRVEIVKAVRAAVAAAHGITIDDVALVRPNSVPKTSSGKLRRGAARRVPGRLPPWAIRVRGRKRAKGRGYEDNQGPRRPTCQHAGSCRGSSVKGGGTASISTRA